MSDFCFTIYKLWVSLCVIAGALFGLFAPFLLAGWIVLEAVK